jgi:hypothetical protein
VSFDKKLRRPEKTGLFFTELLDFPPDSVIIYAEKKPPRREPPGGPGGSVVGFMF